MTDEEIIEAYKMLASIEGVFCEPASAASVAGVIKLCRTGYFQAEMDQGMPEDASVVCILTGHGLKDPDRAIAVAAEPIHCAAVADTVADLLGIVNWPA